MKCKIFGWMEILWRVKFYVKWICFLLKMFDLVVFFKFLWFIKCGYIDCIFLSLNIISENIKVLICKSFVLSIFLIF